MGEGNKRLSKRDAGSGLREYVDRGFLPEGILNYLALLGWGIAEDRDVFTMEEMAEAFDIRRVNPNPARFDLKKREAINAAHMRRISLEDMTERVVPFLVKAGRSVDDPPTDEGARPLLDAAMPLVDERINTLSESVDMLGFLFVDEDDFTRDPADVEKVLDDAGREVVQASYDALPALESTGRPRAIEAALRAKLVEELGLKPRNAFGPVRVAVTGRRISPPLFESLELLGRDRGPAISARRAVPLTPASRCRSRVSGRAAPAAVPPAAPGRPRRLVASGRGILLLAVMMVLVVPFLLQVALVLALVVSGESHPLSEALRLIDLSDPTPVGLAYINLALAALIPAAWFVTRAVHGLKPRWLTSVFPRMRWRFFVACLGLSFVALLATLVVSAVLPTTAAAGADTSMTPNAFDDTAKQFALVVLLLTPLQAAGEEYAFRGYLTQAFGGALPDLGRGRSGPAAAVRAGARRPERPGVLRPVRLRPGRGHPRGPHRRARGGHRDARAEQLAGLRLRSRSATWGRR